MAPETLAANLYVGRLIATARQRKGWKQRELAEAVGLGLPLLTDIEVGRGGLSRERRAALATALGLKPSALDEPGFAILTPEEQVVIADMRKAGKTGRRTHLLKNVLARSECGAASC